MSPNFDYFPVCEIAVRETDELKALIVSDKTGREIRCGVDRKEENIMVREYARTRDDDIFNYIYRNRLPTIRFLARRYAWLCDDPVSEINVVFTRTVNEYGKNGRRTDFNTFFFSSVKNHFANIRKKKFRKKRTLSDGTAPEQNTLPLDSFIGNDSDSSMLHELVASDSDDGIQGFWLQDCIEMLSDGNPVLKEVVEDFLHGTKRQNMKNEHYVRVEVPLPKERGYSQKFLHNLIITAVDLPTHLYEIIVCNKNKEVVVAELLICNKEMIKYLQQMVLEKDIISVK